MDLTSTQFSPEYPMNATSCAAIDSPMIQAMSDLQRAPARSVEERWQATFEGTERATTQPGEIGN
jgi:hypothetical protein